MRKYLLLTAALTALAMVPAFAADIPAPIFQGRTARCRALQTPIRLVLSALAPEAGVAQSQRIGRTIVFATNAQRQLHSGHEQARSVDGGRVTSAAVRRAGTEGCLRRA